MTLIAPRSGELLLAFADVLRAAGYDGPAVAEARRLGLFLPGAEVITALGKDARPETLATLLALFTLGDRVPLDAARDALAPLAPEELSAVGVVELDAGRVSARVRALTHGHLVLLGDRKEDESQDLVRGLYGTSSRVIASLTPREPRGSMLDAGTGSGVQALLAARRCDRVVGTDVNPRAIEYAAINAQINRVDNAHWLQGDWFEPVAGERFDLIVCNPPYAVSPDREFIFRDGGQGDDKLMAGLCREISEHLADDGLGILIGQWPHASPDDWRLAPRRWVQRGGCDAIVLRIGTRDPLDHALGWNLPPNRRLAPAELDRVIARWHAHSRQTGTGAISSGVVVLRRRAQGPRWTLEAELEPRYGEHAARQVTRIIDGNDLLSTGVELDECRFAVPEGFRVSQPVLRRHGAWVRRAAVASAPGELGVSAAIDPDALEVIFRCDGTRTLAELTVNRDKRDTVLGAVRELLSRGLLAVGSGAPAAS